MPSWWSPSSSAPEDAERDVILRRFVEASRRAEIVALVNSTRSDRDVARVTVHELCEALEAEVAFVIVTCPRQGQRETIGHMGLSQAQAAAVSDRALCRAALGAARPEVHEGDDLLGVGARHLALSPWPAESGRQLVIGVARFYGEPFDTAELALLEAVTVSVGHALERAWTGADRDRHAARQAALVRAAKAFSGSLVVEDVLSNLSTEVSQALEADLVAVYRAGERSPLRVAAGVGVPADAIGRPLGWEGLAAEVASAGRPATCQPFDSRPVADPADGQRLRSGMAAPVRVGAGLEAVVLVAYEGERWIEQDDVELLTAFTELGGIALRNATDHAAVQLAAAHDSLTGCLNHGAFQDRLREEIARATRADTSLALVLLDLNGFKAVNDQLGHLAGDALLRGVADALRQSVRAYDQVGRYGGDEFALLLPSTDEKTARGVVDRALAALSRVSLPGNPPVSASAGIAQWRPGECPTALIARADESLLELKRARQRASDTAGAAAGAAVARTGEEDRQRLRRLVTAGALGTRLGQLLDRRAIAETAIADLAAALGYEQSVLVRRADDGGLTVVASGSAARYEDDASSAASEPQDAAVTEALRRCVRERRTVLVAGGGAGTDGGGRSPAWMDLAVPVHVGTELWGALGVRLAGAGGFRDDDAQLVQSVAEHLGSALRTAELYAKLEDTHIGTAAALAAALEAKDHYTADHARSIAELAVLVGRDLGLDEGALRDLRYGAMFHDMGKIAIPDVILNKPGPLDEAELLVIRQHPVVGEQILAPVPFLSDVRRIVRHDHEWWNGAGYPDGLKADEIPLGARIVLVVDAYHAMRSNRPYRAAMTASEARRELLSHSGTQFDPRVVGAFLAVLERLPEFEPA